VKNIANYCFSINHLEEMPLLQCLVIKKGGLTKKSLAKVLSASLTHQELIKTFLIATAKIKIRRHLSRDMVAATLIRGQGPNNGSREGEATYLNEMVRQQLALRLVALLLGRTATACFLDGLLRQHRA
jgi:hypothetical protein